MAERNVLLTTKTSAGLDILYPITKLENISDLDAATHESDGLMLATDKIKLDALATLKIDSGGVYYEI